MGKSSPRPPPTPDPVDSIEAQARANRVDTVTPFGSTRYVSNSAPYGGTPGVGGKGGGGFGPPIPRGDGTYSPGRPTVGNDAVPFYGPSASDYTQVTTLSPELQPVFREAVNSSLSDNVVPFESRILPQDRFDVALSSPGSDRRADAPMRTTFDESGFDPSRIENALFERQTRLLEPRLDQREDRLRQNLADRGIVEGSDAYREALSMELDQANRLRSDAALSSVLAGQEATERDRAFDFSVFADQRDFDQQAYQQGRFLGLQEDTLDQQAFEADRALARALNNDDFSRRLTVDDADRTFYLNRQNFGLQEDQAQFNQLASLLGLLPSNPVQPIDVQGAINNATDAAFGAHASDVAAYNSNQQTTASTISTLATLASVFFSDRRMKTNIRRIGKTDQGDNLYRWDWRDGSGSSVGVMADEVPDRVFMHPSGYLMVDYSEITWAR